MNRSLFTVEEEDGEVLDFGGNEGFSVFTSLAEAQDALDSELHSRGKTDPPANLMSIEYLRRAA